jgi:hypothetical protein
LRQVQRLKMVEAASTAPAAEISTKKYRGVNR